MSRGSVLVVVREVVVVQVFVGLLCVGQVNVVVNLVVVAMCWDILRRLTCASCYCDVVSCCCAFGCFGAGNCGEGEVMFGVQVVDVVWLWLWLCCMS